MIATDKKSEASGGSPERIAKRMARAGLCSRRDAERWIAEGRVKVDGEILTTPAVTVTAASQIEVDGKPLPKAEAPRLFRFHKPTGYLTATRDPEGRKTITELMPEGLPRLMPIGRLDMNSEGLLLLTNDGELKRQLELPSTGWQRRYRVRVHGDIDEAKLAALTKGITIDGFDYGPIEAHLERTLGKNAWLSIALREGKNREIRKVMEHFGWPVNRLIRVSFGPFHLGNLPKKNVEEIRTKVVKEQLGFVLRSATPSSERKRRLGKAKPKSSDVLVKGENKAVASGQQAHVVTSEGRKADSQKRKKPASRRQKTKVLSKTKADTSSDPAPRRPSPPKRQVSRGAKSQSRARHSAGQKRAH